MNKTIFVGVRDKGITVYTGTADVVGIKDNNENSKRVTFAYCEIDKLIEALREAQAELKQRGD